MRDAPPSSWEELPLGDLVTRLVNGGTPPTSIAAYWEGSIPWITGADFTPSGLSDFRRFVSDEAIRQTSTNVIARGALLVVTRTGVGKLAIAPCDVAISQDITGVYHDRQRVAVEFLYHRMRQGVEDLKKLNQGTSINGIVRNDLVSYRIAVPPIPQQQRIAEILSTVDEAIEQTEALIAKTQQIKAGLMQDLFTRGVTADGQLRPPREEAPQLYKESPLGWLPEEWEIASLAEVVDFWDGKRVPLKEEDRASIPGPIPYYGASGIIDWIDRWLFDDDLILLGEDGENIVSRNLPLAFRVSGKCWVNNHAHVLKPKTKQNIDFWTEALEWRDYEHMTSGSAQPKITQRQLARMSVTCPSAPEQGWIASALEAVTDRLNLERRERHKLRQLKRGLMHDLLTGRVAVAVESVLEPKEVAANV